MAVPVRNVKSWAPVMTGVRHWQESIKQLKHLETSFSGHPARGSRASGQMLWAADIEAERVGIAWRWAKLEDDVVVILDPMAVSTNLALTDDDSGEPLSASQLLCCVNMAIYALPWQDRVLEAV